MVWREWNVAGLESNYHLLGALFSPLHSPARGNSSFGFYTHMHVQTHALARGPCKQIYIYVVIHTFLVNGVLDIRIEAQSE